MVDEIGYAVIGAAMRVHNELGPGLLEGCYSDALEVELSIRNIKFEREKQMPLYYRGRRLRDFYLDFAVEGSMILELKAVKEILPVHKSQLMHYLKLSGLKNRLFNQLRRKRTLVQAVSDLTGA